MAREYFCAYHSYLKSMRNLTDAECGRLFRALLQYSAGDKSINLQGRESIAFDFMTEQIDRDEETYNAKCAKLSQNGRQANATKCHQMVANGSKCHQGEGEGKGEGEGDNKENVCYAHEKETNASVSPPASENCPYSDILTQFNDICTSLPSIRSIDGQRRKNVQARWKQYPDIETFKTVFATVEASSFLSGRSGKWRASFDWVINASNFEKILDGNYNDRASPHDTPDTDRLPFEFEFENMKQRDEIETS